MPVAQKANALSLFNICGVTHKYQFIYINIFGQVSELHCKDSNNAANVD